MIGRVVSTKMQGSAVVVVERVAMHTLYKKTFMRSKKYLVEAGQLKDGDVVEIVKVKPISKNKHWKVVRVIGQDLAEITASMLQAEAEKVVSEVMPEDASEPEISEKSGNQSISEPEKSETTSIQKKSSVKKREEK